MIHLNHKDMSMAARMAAIKISQDFKTIESPIKIYGVPRGGIPCMYLVGNYIEHNFTFVDNINEADVIIDDICDSGSTRDKCLKLNPDAKFYALFEKQGRWLIFPYEVSFEGTDHSIDDAIIRLAEFHGISLDSELFESFKNYLKISENFTDIENT